MKGCIYGLIGRKLGHSYSAPIHDMLGNPDYQLIELPPEALAAFMARIDIGGLNVTIPYKRDVMDFCDVISPEAVCIGAVNTIVNRGGRYFGYNTDKYGFLWMAKRAGINFAGKKVLILGSGGTSRTAKAAAEELGAAKVIKISREGADNYENIGRHADADIIVNTTPVGMYPNTLVSPVSLAAFPNCSGVLDVVYNPHRTALLMEAERRHIPCSGGLSMLVAQAKAAEELFFDSAIPDERIEAITGAIRRQAENIVLIGMPGSGKSTIGEALARVMGRDCVDTDRMVEKAAGKAISEIFAEQGEGAFREMEREALRAAAKESGKIICTGGGIVLDPENYAPMRQNGRIYHIARDLDLLATAGRPLSSDRSRLGEMYEKRRPLYARFCDVLIENDGTVSEAADRIWRDFCENTCD